MGVPKSPNPPPATGQPQGDERPTLVPPFDPQKLARDDADQSDRDSLSEEVEIDFGDRDDGPPPTSSPPTSSGGDRHRPEMPTLTDDAELEDARVRSTVTSAPPSFGMPPPARFPAHPSSGERGTGARDRTEGADDPVLEIVGDAEAASLDPLDEARVLVASGDEAGALAVAEGILRKDPSNFVARMVAEECHRVLVSRYSKRLGSVRRIPQIAMSPEQLGKLSLDHRVGFLLALVDGASPIETILDISAMPAPDVLRIFVELYERGVIAFRE